MRSFAIFTLLASIIVAGCQSSISDATGAPPKSDATVAARPVAPELADLDLGFVTKSTSGSEVYGRNIQVTVFGSDYLGNSISRDYSLSDQVVPGLYRKVFLDQPFQAVNKVTLKNMVGPAQMTKSKWVHLNSYWDIEFVSVDLTKYSGTVSRWSALVNKTLEARLPCARFFMHACMQSAPWDYSNAIASVNLVQQY